MKKIVSISAILLLGLSLTACGNVNRSSDSTNSSLKAENSSLKKAENTNIVGSYKDDQNGAAITLNSDGTGRYVYADPTDPDTDDQLTWKKDSDTTYTITLEDSNVTSPLIGKLYDGSLKLSGDSNWNTEVFTKASNNLDLDQFLSNAHGHKSNDSNNNESQKISTPQEAAQYVAAQEHVDPGIVYAMPSGDGFIIGMDDHPYRFLTKNGQLSVLHSTTPEGTWIDGNGNSFNRSNN